MFDKQSATRISDTVRKSEATPFDLRSPHPRVLRAGYSATIPWEIFRFGWAHKSGSPAVITLKSGSVRKSTQTPVTLSDTDVTIGASRTYVGIQVRWSNLTGLQAISPTSVPAHDDTWYREWFYAFELDGGFARLVSVNRFGDIDITAHYGV
jgi:hypothetical protein